MRLLALALLAPLGLGFGEWDESEDRMVEWFVVDGTDRMAEEVRMTSVRERGGREEGAEQVRQVPIEE